MVLGDLNGNAKNSNPSRNSNYSNVSQHDRSTEMAGTSDESNIGELQSDKPSTPGPDKPSSSSGPIHSSTPEIQMNNSTQGSQNSSGTPSFTFQSPMGRCDLCKTFQSGSSYCQNRQN